MSVGPEMVMSAVGLVIGAGAAVVSSFFAWWKLNSKVTELCKDQKSIKTNTFVQKEQMELFVQAYNMWTATVKENNMTQQNLCKAHHDKLNKVTSEVLLQNKSFEYLKDMHEDSKLLQAETTKALNSLNGTIVDLKGVLSLVISKLPNN